MSMTREELDKWKAELEVERQYFAELNKDYNSLDEEETKRLSRLEQNVNAFQLEEIYLDAEENPSAYDFPLQEVIDNQLKDFYYQWCLRGETDENRALSIITKMQYSPKIQKDIARQIYSCMVMGEKEAILQIQNAIYELQRLIIQHISFGCEWWEKGHPTSIAYKTLSCWVDKADFNEFISILLVIEGLNSKISSIQGSKRIDKECNKKLAKTFDFASHPNFTYIMTLLDEVGITRDGISILGEREKSGIRGFVDACVECEILPESKSIEVMYREIAQYIGLELSKKRFGKETYKYDSYYKLTIKAIKTE